MSHRDINSSHNTLIIRIHIINLTQSVGVPDLTNISNKTDITRLQIIATFSIHIHLVGYKMREHLCVPLEPPDVEQLFLILGFKGKIPYILLVVSQSSSTGMPYQQLIKSKLDQHNDRRPKGL